MISKKKEHYIEFNEIEYDSDYPEEEEESPFRKTLKRIYILVIAFFLIILLLSNILGGHVISVLSGKIVSSTLNADYSLDLKNGGKVVFDSAIYEKLREVYLANQKTEIKACLKGEKKDNDYFISSFYVPKIYEKDVYSVTAELCDKETIISLHTHPYLHCIFSNQDIESYNRYRQINPEVMIALMCDETRFTFYGY